MIDSKTTAVDRVVNELMALQGSGLDLRAKAQRLINAAALSATSPAAEIAGTDYAGLIEPHDDVERTVAIVRAAYAWEVTTDGILCGLVAGDMGYASTHIRVEPAVERADANLKIGQTGVTQEGVEYVVVPKEPTEAMLAACHESRPENAKNEATRAAATRLRDSARRIRAMDYRAMTSPSALSANGGR